MTDNLPEMYKARFDEREVSAKDAVWQEIVAYLQRFVQEDAPLLDIACDRGHFIRHARAAERWATDIRDVSAALTPDIRFVQASGLELAAALPTAYFGTIFMSHLNFLDIDTLILAGCTTSGCLRATAVDAYSYNFKVIVPEECAFDRFEASHAINLFDLNCKYVDVIPAVEVSTYMAGLPVRPPYTAPA